MEWNADFFLDITSFCSLLHSDSHTWSLSYPRLITSWSVSWSIFRNGNIGNQHTIANKIALESSLVKEKLNTTSIPNLSDATTSCRYIHIQTKLCELIWNGGKYITVAIARRAVLLLHHVKMHFEPQLMAIQFYNNYVCYSLRLEITVGNFVLA
jgi:hypothetical protein